MLKVLIADDEKLICRLIQALADWDALEMEVIGTAENGIEALEMIKEQKPDILITDIRMPGCDGLELIRQAKKLCPDMEVIIISGYAHFEYAQTAIHFGVGSYLLKPIQQEELMMTLAKIKENIQVKGGNLEVQKHQNTQRDLSRLKESLIIDLLNDEKMTLTEEKLRQYYHMNGRGDCYRIFVMKIDCEIRKINGEAYSIVKEKAEEIFRSGLSDCCEDMLLYFSDYAQYGVVNYTSDKKCFIRKRLRECLNQLEVQKNLFGSVEFTISLGYEVKNPQELGESLKNAQDLIRERILEGTGRVLEGKPSKGSGMSKQGLIDHYAKHIEKAAEAFDTEAAETVCRTLQQELTAIPGICAKEILETVIAAGRLFALRIEAESSERIQEDFIFSCEQCSTVDQLFDGLQLLQRGLIEERKAVWDSESTRPIRLAKKYVHQHYQEPITLEDVCEAIGFSVSYFSSMFKKETGEGFAKYLTRIRMEEAKNLLRETNLPVTEICEKVGYSDRKHFTHTFKKVVGLNPAEYRKLYG